MNEVSKLKKNIGALIGCVMTIPVFICFAPLANNKLSAYLVIFGPSIVGYILDKIYFEPKYNKYINNKINKFNKYKSKYQIPDDAKELKCINADSIDFNFNDKELYVWISKDSLNFANSGGIKNTTEIENMLIDIEDLGKFSLALEQVDFFSRHGDVYTTTSISGGGSSLRRARIGAIVGGEVGAIIHSRKEIKSKTKIIDERETLLKINYNDQEKYIYFDAKAYEVFLRFIPHKEFNLINGKNEGDVYDKLTKLAELREKNIITKVEFEEKKKSLLEKI